MIDVEGFTLCVFVKMPMRFAMTVSEILNKTELPLADQLDLLRLFITFKKLFPNCLLYTSPSPRD